MSRSATQAGAAELVGLAPKTILSEGTPDTQALQAETRTIPIVFVAVTDPLSSGLVASMARPGGNVTGFANYEFPHGREMAGSSQGSRPRHQTRARYGLASKCRPGRDSFRALRGRGTHAWRTAGEGQCGQCLRDRARHQRFAEQPNGGLLCCPEALALYTPDLIVGLAARHRLPAIYPYRSFIAHGGLMSYDTDIADLFRRAASYVDRILKGEKPGDLPVQVPTKYDLVINLKTAKALGLDVPPTLLARADEVIE